MNIIFNREIAEQLKARYTVLELETREEDGVKLEAFCVVTADKIPLGELPVLEDHCRIHDKFLKAYHANQYDVVRTLGEDLYGKFGGELDTFYDEILRRIADK
jgi:hypothetical protein